MISCQPKNIELIRNFETEKKKHTHTNQSNIFRMEKTQGVLQKIIDLQ